jgi:hypothetical protein
VDLAPDCAEARLGLANSLARLGRAREAVTHYEELQRQQPGDPAVILGLARCRHDLHELAEAWQLLDHLLAEQPGQAAALLERGRLAWRLGRPAAAEKDFRRAAALAPFDREARAALYACLQAEGKTAEARDCLARLQQIEAESARRAVETEALRALPR